MMNRNSPGSFINADANLNVLNFDQKFSSDIHRYVNENKARFLTELKRFISYPSISAKKENLPDIYACAHWLAEHLAQTGLSNIQVTGRSHPPIIFAERIIDSRKPTILIYGHYDVQPVNPVSDWQIAPFKPVVKGEYIYGRGASDDKGQILTQLKAIEFYIRKYGKLPVNIKCLFEGEEEIGSPNLRSFLKAKLQLISADFGVISDTAIPAPDKPAITYSQRGALSLDLQISTLKRDLHSGTFGGSVYNPLQTASEIISRLYDIPGHISIPGFYDNVRSWGESELKYMKKVGPSDEKIMRDAGIGKGWGEKKFTMYERITIRPTISVNGIIGGYQGSRVKATIPSTATVKLDFRLVPDQDPVRIENLFRNYIDLISPPSVTTTIKRNFISSPVILQRNNHLSSAARTGYLKGFGKNPIFLRSGGTLPVVDLLRKIAGVPVVLMGYGLPDDGIHGPNEKFYLPNFFNGIITNIYFLKYWE